MTTATREDPKRPVDVLLDDIALVTIGVDAGRPDWVLSLSMFPKRKGETLIFRSGDPQMKSLGSRTRYAGSCAAQSGSDASCRCEGKMERAFYPADKATTSRSPAYSIKSGSPLRQAEDKTQNLRWPYNVILFDRDGLELAKLDPVIIIQGDP